MLSLDIVLYCITYNNYILITQSDNVLIKNCFKLQISKREKDFKPATLLDFGSGLGTATWCVYNLLGRAGGGGGLLREPGQPTTHSCNLSSNTLHVASGRKTLRQVEVTSTLRNIFLPLATRNLLYTKIARAGSYTRNITPKLATQHCCVAS